MTLNQCWVVSECPTYLEKIDYLWYDANRITVTRRNGEYKGELNYKSMKRGGGYGKRLV